MGSAFHGRTGGRQLAAWRFSDGATVSAAPAQLLSAPRRPFHIISRAAVEQQCAATFAGSAMAAAEDASAALRTAALARLASLPGVRSARAPGPRLLPQVLRRSTWFLFLPHHHSTFTFFITHTAAASCPLSTGLRLCIVPLSFTTPVHSEPTKI
jgi:hypothetical protein